MTESILIVDDEPTVIELYQVQLESEFTIEIADSAAAAIELLEHGGPFAVVVSDMQMPGMSGTELLSLVEQRWPDCVRVMLTGNDEQQVAVDAVNEGNIFRFLNKPCPAERLAKALTACLDQYRLVQAEKELLDQTLGGSLGLLTDLLSTIKPLAFGRATRVKRIVDQLCHLTELDAAWEVSLAAMLSQIGCVSLSDLTLEKLHAGKELSELEQIAFDKHPAFGGSLITKIPRLQRVGALIAAQELPFAELKRKKSDGGMVARAAFLKVALAYDRLIQANMAPRVAVKNLQSSPAIYSPDVVTLLETLVASKLKDLEADVSVAELRVGMVLVEDVFDQHGRILVTKGQEISEFLHSRLYDRADNVVQPIRVVKQLTSSSITAPATEVDDDQKDVPAISKNSVTGLKSLIAEVPSP